MFIAMTDELLSAMPVVRSRSTAWPERAPPPATTAGVLIKVSAQQDGTFTVTNARNGIQQELMRGG